MANVIHPFELANLGTAPFRIVRAIELTFQAAPGEPVRAGGSCDYCSTAIQNAYIVRGADGREFKVGCECVRKVAKAAADTALARSQYAADAPKRAAAKAKRNARIIATQKRLAETFEARIAPETLRMLRVMSDDSAFRGMLRDIETGRRADLSPRQLSWLRSAYLATIGR